MIRKLVFALSLIGIFVAGNVLALGLGEATVKSSLNQPLNAEIELVNTGELSVDEVLPGLATREEFIRAGVERVFFLSDIRFRVIRKSSGNLVIRLTTNKPVREPFLNFLVEVIWPSGRLLREYALLVDPPIFNQEKTAPVALAAVAEPQTLEPKAQPVEDKVAEQSVSSSAESTATNSGQDTFGPTSSSDTLWGIALKVRPSKKVTIQQTMLAIQDLNPDAFVDQNINKIKTGKVLRIPDLNQIQSRSRRQAVREVMVQNRALSKAPAEAARKSMVVADSKRQAVKGGDELKLVVAKKEVKTGATGTNAGQAKSGAGASATMPANENNELAITLEKLDKANIENQELNSRVGDLEGQLQTLKRLLALKDDQLASMQQQAMTDKAANADVNAAGKKAGVAADQAPAAEMSNSGSDVEPATVATNASVKPEVVDSNAVKGSDVTKDSNAAKKEAESTLAKTEPAKVVPAMTKKAPAEAVSRKGADDLVSQILANPLYLAGLGVAVVLVLVLLLLLSRHNARKEQAFQESLENADEEGYAEEGDIDDEDESYYEDDETIAAAESGSDEDLSEDQNDVMAEADVYVAYGRLDQAAQLLEKAISAEPVRSDYRLKLLEVYKESDDRDAFDTQLNELEAIQDEDALQQARLLRDDFDMQSVGDERDVVDEAFAEDSVDEVGIDSPDDSIGSDVIDTVDSHLDDNLDIDFNIDDLELNKDGSIADDDLNEVNEAVEEDVSSVIDDSELDLSLDLQELDAEPATEQEAESDPELEAALDEELELEVDLPDVELDSTGLPESGDLSESADLEEAVDLDLSDEILDESAGVPLSDTESADDLQLDDVDLAENLDQENEFELPDDLAVDDDTLSLSGELEAEVEAGVEHGGEQPAVEESASEDVDDSILDSAEIAMDAESSTTGASLEEDEEFDFLAGADEVATKLDLARAYIDMGDVDGARDILEEVTSEGNDEQQQEAKDLLDSLV